MESGTVEYPNYLWIGSQACLQSKPPVSQLKSGSGHRLVFWLDSPGPSPLLSFFL